MTICRQFRVVALLLPHVGHVLVPGYLWRGEIAVGVGSQGERGREGWGAEEGRDSWRGLSCARTGILEVAKILLKDRIDTKMAKEEINLIRFVLP